ncbi:unnamed protein product [Menidia menidia]|uniref:(Atlantic silverside) hypothetical protein n=1 Tax=Menidia menidia TaxID=238744 RepID=A0A8S4BFY6_9TELE|nr:unnamed protein product [Menidia menidia]
MMDDELKSADVKKRGDKNEENPGRRKSQTVVSKGPAEVDSNTGGADLCASILLACLFCRPLDCLLATARGCGGCVWWLCSSLCGCTPGGLQPLLDVAHGCHLCGCLALRRSPCDFSVCEVCLHATECVDLGMEISQMLNH